MIVFVLSVALTSAVRDAVVPWAVVCARVCVFACVCVQATVLAHPRAAPHLIDPTRLVGAVRQVYGDAAFDKMYGEIEPIDASRVRSMADGSVWHTAARCSHDAAVGVLNHALVAWRCALQTAPLGECRLRFMHTRGHANHHMVVIDEDHGNVFTGDSFGIAYPKNAVEGRFDGRHHSDGCRFMFPGTAPADYDTDEAMKAVEAVSDAPVVVRLRGEPSRAHVPWSRLLRWLTESTWHTTGRGTILRRESSGCAVA